MGTIRPLASGRWQAFYRLEGKTYRAPQTFERKADAQLWLMAERTDRARGAWQDPQEQAGLTLEEWATTWLASRVDLAPKTRYLYEHSLSTWVLPKLGKLGLRELTAPVVRRWFAQLVEATAQGAKAQPDGHKTNGHPARAWARAHGYPVADTGRLSPKILAAYRAALEAGQPMPRPRREDNTGRTAARNAYSVLRATLNAAKRDGLIENNPCTIEGAGTTKPAERIPATPQQVADLADHVPKRLRAAVWIAAWSGLRFGELFGLARQHIDLDAGTLRVARALSREGTFTQPKTASSLRTVWLPAFVTDKLRDHMDTYTGPAPDALVFPNTAGGPMRGSYVHLHFRRAAVAIGRDDLRWHDLRHTGATLAYSAGGTIRDVQRRLGHATARAALIYAHAADDGDRRLAEAIHSRYAPTTPTPPKPPLRVIDGVA